MRRFIAALALSIVLVAASFQPAHAAPRARYATGWSIAQTARAYLGSGYYWVGTCTGLIHNVFARYGYWVPMSLASIAYNYPYVAPRNLQPGDVLVFANTVWPGLSHVAIYVGNGWMVGADNPSWGVHLDYLYDSYWYSRWVRSVRIAW